MNQSRYSQKSEPLYFCAIYKSLYRVLLRNLGSFAAEASVAPVLVPKVGGFGLLILLTCTSSAREPCILERFVFGVSGWARVLGRNSQESVRDYIYYVKPP